jgi:hypothetical protein
MNSLNLQACHITFFIKNNSTNSRKIYFFKLVPQLYINKDVVHVNLYFHL